MLDCILYIAIFLEKYNKILKIAFIEESICKFLISSSLRRNFKTISLDR